MAWGGRGISRGQERGMSENGPWVMAHSHDTPTGPPTCWVPPCDLPAIPPDRVSPHLSGDDRGMCGQLAAVGSKMGDGWWRRWKKTMPRALCGRVWLNHTDRQVPQDPSTRVAGTGWVRVANSQPVPAPAVTCSTNPHGFVNPWHSLATAAHYQQHAEKAFWTMAYMLPKAHSSPLSVSCTKGLLDPDSHPVQNPNHFIVSIMEKIFLDPDLHPVQNPEQPILSIM